MTLVVVLSVFVGLWLASFGWLVRGAWRSSHEPETAGSRPLIGYVVVLVLVSVFTVAWAASLPDGYPSGSGGRQMTAVRAALVAVIAISAFVTGHVGLAKRSWRTVAAIVSTVLVTVALLLLATTQKPSCCTNWTPDNPSSSPTSTVEVP